MKERGVTAAPKASISKRASRYFRATWRRYRGVLLASAVTTVLVAGMIGWGERDSHLSVLNRLYFTMQLFTLSTSEAPPYPAVLQIARCLAPFALAYGTFRAITAIFSEPWSHMRVRLWREGHTVVCGFGRCGKRFAEVSTRKASAWSLSMMLLRSPTWSGAGRGASR